MLLVVSFGEDQSGCCKLCQMIKGMKTRVDVVSFVR